MVIVLCVTLSSGAHTHTCVRWEKTWHKAQKEPLWVEEGRPMENHRNEEANTNRKHVLTPEIKLNLFHAFHVHISTTQK